MAVPVKVSDRLLALAKAEARGTHRSATAQIEHWATLGRAVETLIAYRDVLALKRAGLALPVPPFAGREAVRDVLARLVRSEDREDVRARIRAAGTPLYAADPDDPGRIVEIAPDGTRTPGRLERRRFVATRKRTTRRRA